MQRPLRVTALAILLAVAGGCEKPAPQDAAQVQPEKKPEPAFVEGLPRDQWLTLNTAIPLASDGKEVRDEKRRPYSYALLGKAVPAFSAQLVGGGEATAELFRGKWTIVDIWGVWCGDCRRDAPLVKQLAALADADPDIDFISIHTPPNRARAAEAYGQFGSVEAFFESQGGGYPTILDTDASLREALNIVWTPSYLLIGPDLNVHAFRTDLSVGGEGNPSRVIEEAKKAKAVQSSSAQSRTSELPSE